ncbi:MAG: 2-phospho-L-lactate guanylyltransferase [Pusillimonas sp.]|nr:2-phospho-L-lactate guanylyltransferase [Pusillimonas sp.]MBC43096.1 2-phospho-L-lactate guanylyltransferase [Pusillimonas sp.]|tara:strand:+ start:12652 stop:13401 length:750 start_codon:yes stop_codon:yes gene_type:complete
MTAHRLAAVIPVKSFSDAKQRLQPVLSAGERRLLARAMFEDVMATLTQCPALTGVYVITSDPQAAQLAANMGVKTLRDPVIGGLSGAIASAAQTLKKAGMEGMLVVPADVPGIDPQSVRRIISHHAASRSVTLVPALRDGGTNAMLCSPPDAIPNCFGHNSFRAHCQLAASSGVQLNTLSLPQLQYDIDRPLDLLSFMNQESATRTYRFLVQSGIADRLRHTSRTAFSLAGTFFPYAEQTPALSSIHKG